jgi:hypothetical protein
VTPGKKATRCLNCGRDAGPGYCPHCGQEVEIRQGPLLEVGREVLADWLSLDSRLLRSLRALLRPGRLSEFYVEGKRAPFLRPFRLYLLASLILFSTLLTLEAPADTGLNLRIGGKLVGAAPQGRVQRSIEFLKGEGFPGRWILQLAGDRVDRLHELPRQEVLETLFSGLRRMLPTTLIFFAPFLGLGLKLLYVRGRARHTQYLDHLAFSLHFQSALFMALSLAWLVTRPLGPELLASAIAYGVVGTVMLFVYLPLSLRRFYGQSRRWTAVKTLAVLFLYSQLLGLAVDLSVLVGIWNI